VSNAKAHNVGLNLDMGRNGGKTHVVFQQQTIGLAAFFSRERENRGNTLIRVGDVSVQVGVP